MAKVEKVKLTPEQKALKRQRTLSLMKKGRWMYLLMLPGFLWFIIFCIIPMWGVLIAFMDYYAGVPFLKTSWVGFNNFYLLFTAGGFWSLFRNTLIISLMNLIFYFPLPIILSLLLNEIKVQWYKKVLQTFVYVPHFVSMVVIASITFMLIKVPATTNGTMSGGAIYEILYKLTGKSVDVMAKDTNIYWILLIQSIWKETGWGTVIFLAALAGVDVEQYEAAIVDGANRWQRLIYITVPSILGTIVTMFILRMGSVLSTGFEQIILMQNDLNKSCSETFDTNVYNLGRVGGNYGYSTAVGLFKSIVSIICIQTANTLAKKVGQEGLY